MTQTATKAEPTVAVVSLETVEEMVLTDVTAWVAGLTSEDPFGDIYPDPRDVGGLPDGWTVMGHFPGYQTDTDLFLTRRDGGG